MALNKVMLVGNLTRDPDLRQTAGGTAVLNLGLAVNESRKNPQTGEWDSIPNFFDAVMFGGRAESVSRYLSKGSKVAISGRLQWSQWEKDGQKCSKVNIIVEDLEFMSKNNQSPAAQGGGFGLADEDIPF